MLPLPSVPHFSSASVFYDEQKWIKSKPSYLYVVTTVGISLTSCLAFDLSTHESYLDAHIFLDDTLILLFAHIITTAE